MPGIVSLINNGLALAFGGGRRRKRWGRSPLAISATRSTGLYHGVFVVAGVVALRHSGTSSRDGGKQGGGGGGGGGPERMRGGRSRHESSPRVG